MLELTLDNGGTRLGVAGDTYNTAVYLKRLSPTTDVAYVTLLGCDPLSNFVLNAVTAENLNIHNIGKRCDKTIGLYAVALDERRERSFTYWRSDSAARGLFGKQSAIVLHQLSKFDLVYLSGITLAILEDDTRSEFFHWVARYRAAGGLVAFDSNYRPALWRNPVEARQAMEKMWSLCDLALPSISDEVGLFNDPSEVSVIERIVKAGTTRGCLKRAERGPKSFDGSELLFERVPTEDVIDTTAAGDSFNAGFISAFITGRSVEECMFAGQKLASEVIKHRGAIIPKENMPSLFS